MFFSKVPHTKQGTPTPIVRYPPSFFGFFWVLRVFEVGVPYYDTCCKVPTILDFSFLGVLQVFEEMCLIMISPVVFEAAASWQPQKYILSIITFFVSMFLAFNRVICYVY